MGGRDRYVTRDGNQTSVRETTHEFSRREMPTTVGGFGQNEKPSPLNARARAFPVWTVLRFHEIVSATTQIGVAGRKSTAEAKRGYAHSSAGRRYGGSEHLLQFFTSSSRGSSPHRLRCAWEGLS